MLKYAGAFAVCCPLLFWGCGTKSKSVDITTQPRNQDLERLASNIHLKVTGVRREFYVVPDPRLKGGNAYTTNRVWGRSGRYIVYDPEALAKRGLEHWDTTGTLCHEIGHQVYLRHDGKFVGGYEGELAADEWAGFCLYRIGATPEQALEWTNILTEEATGSHPARKHRIAAVREGYSLGEENDRELNTTLKSQVDQLTAKVEEEIGSRKKVESRAGMLEANNRALTAMIEDARRWKQHGQTFAGIGAVLFMIAGAWVTYSRKQHRLQSLTGRDWWEDFDKLFKPETGRFGGLGLRSKVCKAFEHHRSHVLTYQQLTDKFWTTFVPEREEELRLKGESMAIRRAMDQAILERLRKGAA